MIASEIKEYVRQQLMRLSRWSTVARTAANGWDEVTTQARGLGEPQGQDPARRMQHYGFRSTPPAGSEVVILACSGSASQRVIVASELPGAGPQSQPSGDVEVYAADEHQVTVRANGATVVIDKDGKVTVDAVAGQDVTVNGGTAAVGRVGDAVGYLVITYAPVPPSGTVVVTAATWSATIPGGAVTPPVPGTPGVYYQPLRITAGAPHFKA